MTLGIKPICGLRSHSWSYDFKYCKLRSGLLLRRGNVRA